MSHWYVCVPALAAALDFFAANLVGSAFFASFAACSAFAAAARLRLRVHRGEHRGVAVRGDLVLDLVRRSP